MPGGWGVGRSHDVPSSRPSRRTMKESDLCQIKKVQEILREEVEDTENFGED